MAGGQVAFANISCYVWWGRLVCPSQKMMNKPEHFEIKKDYAVFRPTGQVSLEKVVQMVIVALEFAREHQISKLLVVTTGLPHIEPPNLSTRYFFIRDWARAAQGEVCIAFAARAAVIDFQKIGVVIAENDGFHCDVFASEDEALAWLQCVKTRTAVRLQ